MSGATDMEVAVACGGTGGHLFPGLAVGRELRARGVGVTLLVSPKEVDREAVAGVTDLRVRVLPAVGLQGRNYLGFGWSVVRSMVAARRLFRERRPSVVLGMGGFTSVPPILAGRWMGCRTALHESNTVPGRANRWLGRRVDLAMVGFEEASGRWGARSVEVTGTPVRECIRPLDATSCRVELGLDPAKPVLTIMGGSQGATGLNRAMAAALPQIVARWPFLQCLHLCGHRDLEAMRRAHAEAGMRSVVEPFSSRMERVLGATTVAVARSGASTLAEFAAAGVPSVLVPFPASVDDHQRFNARAMEVAGAARVMEPADMAPGRVVVALACFLDDEPARARCARAALGLHRPDAARRMADRLVALARVRGTDRGGRDASVGRAVPGVTGVAP